MIENNVTIFFHGHDHFFAKQELDGIVYQLVPQPSHPNYEKAGQASKYGYITGDILPPSGHLRVTVSNSMVTVDYVRVYLPADENPAAGRVNGKVDYSYTIHAQNTSILASDPPKYLPQGFQLYQNYPNPFNPETFICFQIQKSCHVVIQIYSIGGREIKTLIDEKREAGFYQLSWDGKDNLGKKVSTGIYLYQLKAEEFVAVKKMLMIQ